MLRNWPILFIVIPLVELYLIIEVGSRIGALWTVLLVIATAFVGISLLRLQGLSTLRRAQQSMAMGSIPTMEIMEGMALAIGGALLITPGFITDSIGFLCLIPVTRRAIIRYIMARSNVHIHGQSGGRGGPQGSQPPPDKKPQQGRIIEGEYERKDD